MKILNLLYCCGTSLCLFSCAKSIRIGDQTIKIRSLNKAEINLLFQHDQQLLLDIAAFEKEKRREQFVRMSVKDLYDLHFCEKPSRCYFQEFPHNLQAIYDFNVGSDRKHIRWLHNGANAHLKNGFIQFINKHASEEGALEYMQLDLKDCYEDPEYRAFLNKM